MMSTSTAQHNNIHFRFSYTLEPEASNLYGNKINGTWNGMIGQMVRKARTLSFKFVNCII
jgi:hypothetical protein